ncbi:MAG: hypothetical protein HC926_01465 [Synechococcaceae cyanobacterium SM2_3_60]|nr:hypothetical protein [Synechococcaceae cyanobacterium SM2_3_60]
MFRVLALACLICLPAHAEPKVWMGSGQVVSGQGQGATVQLVIETDGGRIRTHSGPHLDATLSGQPQTLETDTGTWHIEPMGDRMGVTLYRVIKLFAICYSQQVLLWITRPRAMLTLHYRSTPSLPI